MKKKGKQIIDPVCGMNLTGVKDRIKASYKGAELSFCEKDCRDTFRKDPKKYQGQPLIELRKVWKIFHLGDVDVKVLRGLDLNIWEGDFVVIIGASGSGKSTALNMIGLLDRPTRGDIFLRGQDVSLLKDDERAKLRSDTFGFVFQHYNLIPWLTAYENITLSRVFAQKKIDKNKFESSFKEIGLGDRMLHRPFELSGGEQQRVALLRALANDPEIIIGDEPTGNLDSATGKKILKILTDLNKKQNKTLIIVTHDATIAEMADQVITIKDGQVVRGHRAYKKIYTD